MADSRDKKSLIMPGERKPAEHLIDLGNARFAAIREELEKPTPNQNVIKELCDDAQIEFAKARKMAESLNDNAVICEAMIGIAKTFNAQGNVERANIFFVQANHIDPNKYEEVCRLSNRHVERGGAPKSVYGMPEKPEIKDQKPKSQIQIIDNYDPNKAPDLPARNKNR